MNNLLFLKCAVVEAIALRFVHQGKVSITIIYNYNASERNRTFFIYLIWNCTYKLNLHIIFIFSVFLLLMLQSDNIILCHSQAALNVVIQNYFVLFWTRAISIECSHFPWSVVCFAHFLLESNVQYNQRLKNDTNQGEVIMSCLK